MNHYLLICECDSAEEDSPDGFAEVPLYLAAGMKLIESFASTVTGDMVLEMAASLHTPINAIFGLVVQEFKDGVPVAGVRQRINAPVSIPTSWQ